MAWRCSGPVRGNWLTAVPQCAWGWWAAPTSSRSRSGASWSSALPPHRMSVVYSCFVFVDFVRCYPSVYRLATWDLLLYEAALFRVSYWLDCGSVCGGLHLRVHWVCWGAWWEFGAPSLHGFVGVCRVCGRHIARRPHGLVPGLPIAQFAGRCLCRSSGGLVLIPLMRDLVMQCLASIVDSC